MSITIGIGADGRGETAGGGALDDIMVGSAAGWVRLSDGTPATTTYFFSKNGSRLRLVVTSTGLLSFRRGRTSFAIITETALASFAAFSVDRWLFVGVRWDENQTATDQELVVGNESEAPAEPSGYSAQELGSGGAQTDVGYSFLLGNGPSFTGGWGDDLHSFALFPGVYLSNAQFESLRIALATGTDPTTFSPVPEVCWYLTATSPVADGSGHGHALTLTNVQAQGSAPNLGSVAYGRAVQPLTRVGRRPHLRRPRGRIQVMATFGWRGEYPATPEEPPVDMSASYASWQSSVPHQAAGTFTCPFLEAGPLMTVDVPSDMRG